MGSRSSNTPLGASRPPWMRPLLKLHMLRLAKMQWDVRQCPARLATAAAADPPWPSKAVARAVPKLRSPCVAGDLLQQRAPGLVPHVRSCRRLTQSSRSRRWEVAEEGLDCIDTGLLSAMSFVLCANLPAPINHPMVPATLGGTQGIVNPQLVHYICLRPWLHCI
jgi:hypothetical protein